MYVAGDVLDGLGCCRLLKVFC